MERRFYDVDVITSQAYRKLAASFRSVYFYLWSKCDKCGVYVVDVDYFKIDTGEKFSETMLEKLENLGLKKIGAGAYFFSNFIEVQYGVLKENYNPHKPVWRDLKKNNLLELYLSGNISSLNQACGKLEEEEEDKEEEEEEDNKKKKRSKEKAPEVSFSDSEYFDFEVFKKFYEGTDWQYADLQHYYDSAVDYSAQGNKYVNWAHAVRSWMRKDNAAGRLKLGKGVQKVTPQQEIRLNATEEILKRMNYGK